MLTRKHIGIVAIGAAATVLLAGYATATDTPQSSTDTARSQPAAQTAPSNPDQSASPRGQFTPEQLMGSLGKQLIAGLESTPGCLGAEAAAFSSGKLVIFGWFEDKEAAMAWHDSEVHRGVSERFSGGRKMERPPMEHIAPNVPLMVVASVAMEPPTNQGPPRMKFGIEVYQPLPGGFTFQGGAFSPPGFQGLMEEIRERADD